jgi:hypothetical protein
MDKDAEAGFAKPGRRGPPVKRLPGRLIHLGKCEDANDGKGIAQVGAMTAKSRTKLPMIKGLLSVCITVNH